MDTLTFDYKTIDVNQKNAIEFIDCYEALGWELANKKDTVTSATLTFKRNRKIKNKDQLNRMQLKLEDRLNGIKIFEKKKTSKATAFSIIIGIIGTLIFGSALCFCLPDVFQAEPDVWMYIVGGILALVGLVLCGLSFLTYKNIRAKSTIAMNTLIDKKRDEISQICEDAQRLFN